MITTIEWQALICELMNRNISKGELVEFIQQSYKSFSPVLRAALPTPAG